MLGFKSYILFLYTALFLLPNIIIILILLCMHSIVFNNYNFKYYACMVLTIYINLKQRYLALLKKNICYLAAFNYIIKKASKYFYATLIIILNATSINIRYFNLYITLVPLLFILE